MIFGRLNVIEESKLEKLLWKIERCRERCRTEGGVECLNDLEYNTAEKLDTVREWLSDVPEKIKVDRREI